MPPLGTDQLDAAIPPEPFRWHATRHSLELSPGMQAQLGPN